MHIREAIALKVMQEEALERTNGRRWARVWKKKAIGWRKASEQKKLFLLEAVRITELDKKRIQELEEWQKKAKPLLQETVGEHSDRNFEGYNECDLAPCQWCTEARELLPDIEK